MALESSAICPILVGRGTHLAELDAFLNRIAHGEGGVVLISGEAGIGKSRLVREVSTLAAARGLTVMQGHCFESDRSLPYAPIVDMLRSFCAAAPASTRQSALRPYAHELIKLVPEIGDWLADITPAPLRDPEQDRSRMFHSIAGFLLALAAQGPLTVVFEDLHWCDELSLGFLVYLARCAPGRPLGILATYRSDEVFPRLAHTLAELDRGRLAVELAVPSLDVVQVETMLRAIFALDRPMRVEFVEAIISLTGGNPFFIEEVLRSLVSTGGIYFADGAWSRRLLAELRIPRTVQDAVQRRCGELSGEAMRTVEIAAAIGQRVDLDLLRRLLEVDEDEIVRRVKELIRAQLVLDVSSDHVLFRHALTREAIYASLMARERRALHRRIADTLYALSRDRPESPISDLAYHYAEAGVWEQAMTFAHQAAESAQRLYAPTAVIIQATRALDAAAHLAAAPQRELLRLRGRAHETLGEWDDAHADYVAALDTARAGVDRRAEWEALIDLGMLWAGRDYQQAHRYYAEAAALARTVGEDALIAHSANRIGNWYLNGDRPLEARKHHLEALTIFERLGDERGRAATLDLLGMTSYLGGDLIAGTDYLTRAVALFRLLDDRPGLASSLATLTLRGATIQTDSMALPETTLAACIEDGEAALHIAREIHSRSAEAYALLMLGFCLGSQGTYSRASLLAADGLRIADEIGHLQWQTAGGCVLGYLALDWLDIAGARRRLEPALALARRIGSSHWTQIAAGLLASAHIAEHDIPGAAETLAHAARADRPARTLGERIVHCAHIELCLARRQPQRALDLTAQLAPAGSDGAGAAARAPRLAWLRGRALTDLGRAPDAAYALQAAARVASEHGALPLLWRIDLALARLYQELGRRDQAALTYGAARDTIASLTEQLPDRAIGARFSAAALERLPTAFRLVKHHGPAGQAELTPRERQVAAQIQRGCSNREIAATLYIGERTVETHVTNILGKLDFSARAQIAAWAARQDLD